MKGECQRGSAVKTWAGDARSAGLSSPSTLRRLLFADSWGQRRIVMAGSHVVVGLAAWSWAAPHLGLPVLDPFALGYVTIGALLPDIDHPSSWVGRRLRIISRPLAAMIGHRGVTHSLVAVLGCLVFLRWEGLRRAVVDPLVVGYLSHLAADLLTTNGLRLTWPSPKRQAIGLCRTGSFTETVIVAGVAMVTGFHLLRPHWALGL
jgi:inner membrane protein